MKLQCISFCFLSKIVWPDVCYLLRFSLLQLTFEWSVKDYCCTTSQCYMHVLNHFTGIFAYSIYQGVGYWYFPAYSFQYLCFSHCFLPLTEHYALCEGDVNGIVIGSGTNIQDNSLVHVAKSNLSGKVLPTIIGDNVTVGEWMWWIIILWMT